MPMLRRCAANAKWPPIERNMLATLQRVAQCRYLAIDRESTLPDPLFNLATGTVACRSQNLLYSIRQDWLFQPPLADAS